MVMEQGEYDVLVCINEVSVLDSMGKGLSTVSFMTVPCSFFLHSLSLVCLPEVDLGGM